MCKGSAALLRSFAAGFGAVIYMSMGGPANAQVAPVIPSIDALTAPGPAFVPYRSNIPALAPISSGPAIFAARSFHAAAPSDEYQTDADVSLDIVKGMAAGKLFFDPIRDTIQGSLERGGYSAMDSTLGSDMLDFAFKWRTAGVDLGDYAGWAAGLPMFAKWVAPCVGAVITFLTCSDTQTPEMDDPNSMWNAIYAGIDYSPTGQYSPINTATPPSTDDGDNSQPRPDCDAICQQQYAQCEADFQCYCDYINPGYEYCCLLDDSCCDDPNGPMCLSATRIKNPLLAIKKSRPRPLSSNPKPRRASP